MVEVKVLRTSGAYEVYQCTRTRILDGYLLLITDKVAALETAVTPLLLSTVKLYTIIGQ